jgi:hypothetical protein
MSRRFVSNRGRFVSNKGKKRSLVEFPSYLSADNHTDEKLILKRQKLEEEKKEKKLHGMEFEIEQIQKLVEDAIKNSTDKEIKVDIGYYKLDIIKVVTDALVQQKWFTVYEYTNPTDICPCRCEYCYEKASQLPENGTLILSTKQFERLTYPSNLEHKNKLREYNPNPKYIKSVVEHQEQE